jgi:hypothetical protein
VQRDLTLSTVLASDECPPVRKGGSRIERIRANFWHSKRRYKSLFLDEYRYVVYGKLDWDWRTFDVDRDAAKAHAIDSRVDEFDPPLPAAGASSSSITVGLTSKSPRAPASSSTRPRASTAPWTVLAPTGSGSSWRRESDTARAVKDLTPSPKVARYDGKGTADNEASFVCRLQ